MILEDQRLEGRHAAVTDLNRAFTGGEGAQDHVRDLVRAREAIGKVLWPTPAAVRRKRSDDGWSMLRAVVGEG